MVNFREITKRAAVLIFDLIEDFVIVASVGIVIYYFFVQPHQVRGGSMIPNFHDGEYILTDKVSYRFNNPERGDIIVFKAHTRLEQDFIKRIIGLPDDHISLHNGSYYINGKLFEEPYLPKDFITSPREFLGEDQEVFVPEDEYFVSGDNRSLSSDSRAWGFIKRGEIIGKVWLRYWPPQKFSFIQKPNY